ncbi:hypothetical protein JTB14_012336 [Gonioctena quinquepunctata]|nr:hypothetical protein JTB14_012336 [Gonioctena quinquepunctata]
MSAERKKRTGGMTCCVVGCTNTSVRNPEVKFYSFPSSNQDWKQGLRMKWINAVKRKNLDNTPWQPKKSSYVCSEHFVGGRKSNIAAHPAFVPTIFPAVYNKRKTNTSALAGYERVNRRKARKLNEPSTGESKK